MTRWYDEEEDILGIRIQDKAYWKSIELPSGIVIDLSKDGEVIGMEIHRASRIFLGDIKKVLTAAKAP